MRAGWVLIYHAALWHPASAHAFCDTSDALIKSVHGHVETWNAQILTASNVTWNCTDYLGYIFLSRDKIRAEIDYVLGNVSGTEGNVGLFYRNSWVMSQVSKAASLVSAHVHLQTSFGPHTRPECYTEDLRLFSFISLRRLKELTKHQLRYLWFVFQHTADQFRLQAVQWLENASHLFLAELKTYRQVMLSWNLSEFGNPDIMLATPRKSDTAVELMRNYAFDADEIEIKVAKGVMRVAARGDTVCEVNAGNGMMSLWLNQTGWLTAFGFDRTPAIEMITFDAVQSMEWMHNRTYDWMVCVVNCSGIELTAQKGVITISPDTVVSSYKFNATASAIFAQLDLSDVKVLQREAHDEL